MAQAFRGVRVLYRFAACPQFLPIFLLTTWSVPNYVTLLRWAQHERLRVLKFFRTLANGINVHLI